MRVGTVGLFCGLAALLSGCGGSSPTAPSGGETGLLSGTWNGTVSVLRENQPPAIGPATWTFVLVPETAGLSYRATVRAQHPWLPATYTATTTLTPPGIAPALVTSLGDYDSPRGCRGTFGSFGEADTRRLVATFEGVDCGLTFTGTVELTR